MFAIFTMFSITYLVFSKWCWRQCSHRQLGGLGQGLVEEILILVRCEVGLSRCLAAERLTIAYLLQVVQAAGDTLVAGAVEGIEGDLLKAYQAAVTLQIGLEGLRVTLLTL